jgi:hypothetical protein
MATQEKVGQVPMWSKPQESLHKDVDTARQATNYNSDLYSATHDHLNGVAQMTEKIGSQADSTAPNILVDQHRIDAKMGSPSEQVHVYVKEDPITGEVAGGGAVSGINSQGEQFEHRLDGNADAARQVAALIAQNVTRQANEAQAAQTEQPDVSKLV